MKMLLAISLIATILFHDIPTRYLLIEVEDSDQLPKAPSEYENKFNSYFKFAKKCFLIQDNKI